MFLLSAFVLKFPLSISSNQSWEDYGYIYSFFCFFYLSNWISNVSFICCRIAAVISHYEPFHTVFPENRTFPITMSMCVCVCVFVCALPAGDGMLFFDCHKIVIQLAVVHPVERKREKSFRTSSSNTRKMWILMSTVEQNEYWSIGSIYFYRNRNFQVE